MGLRTADADRNEAWQDEKLPWLAVPLSESILGAGGPRDSNFKARTLSTSPRKGTSTTQSAKSEKGGRHQRFLSLSGAWGTECRAR